MKKMISSILALAAASFICLANAPERDSVKTETQQNSSIFLNAASDSKPREISLGLPTNTLSAVHIFEDGLPVSYYIYQLFPFKSWHGGESSLKNGTMGPMETAMRMGEINTYVDSYNREGGDEFRGTFSYTAGSFGQHKFDVNISGPIAKGWSYSLSTYQNFDPGSNQRADKNLHDRHQFYKGVLTKRFNDGNGHFNIVYQHVDYVTMLDNNGPFIFVGDGSVEPYNGFSLGTDCYIPNCNVFKYKDVRNGEFKESNINDRDVTDHLTFVFERNLSDRVHFDFKSRYKTGTSKRGSSALSSTTTVSLEDGYTYAGGQPYAGLVQMRILNIHDAYDRTWFNNGEIQFSSGNHSFRTGFDYFLNKAGDYVSSAMLAHEVCNFPEVLYLNGEATSMFNNASDYYEGTENKLALYAKDEWKVNSRIDLTGFIRAEFLNVKGNSANVIGDETCNIRRPGFDLTQGRLTGFNDSSLNGAFGLDANVKIVGGLSFKAQVVGTRIHPTLFNYGGETPPNGKPTDTKFAQAGLSYVNDWINVTSQLVYIEQSNNMTRSFFSHVLTKPVGDIPAGTVESKTLGIVYGIQSLGWTTDAMITPFDGFSLHAALTVRDPKYKDFIFTPTFSDGVTESYDFSGNNVTALHKVEFTLDPSYTIKDWRFWLTARYISKQYINKTNSLYFAGRWETFAGIDYKLNEKCRFSLNLINLLNQKGASGTISSADLVTDPSPYQNYVMAGKFIRPFTVELGMTIDF